MDWEKLNVLQFQQAVKDSDGVCLLPVGCLEKHGDHLPLGTDLFFGRDVAFRAAAREPAVVFPNYPFGQISECRHMIGTIALESRLQMELMQALCDEIANNGFDKIIMINAHGGNTHMLRYFMQTQLDKRRDYMVYGYFPMEAWRDKEREHYERFGQPDGSGHADVEETGFIMAYDQSLVHMENVDAEQSRPQKRLWHLHHAYAGIGWYGDYPYQFAGDPTGATAERGAAWRDIFVDDLVQCIRSVKDGGKTAAVLKEFFDKCDKPGV